MTRFKYYTIYRCKHCGKRIPVHGKLTSKLILPSDLTVCCNRPKLIRERAVLIDEYDREQKQQPDESAISTPTKQKSLAEYSKTK